MLNLFNLEKQAGKRVQKLIAHLSAAEALEARNARMVLNTTADKVSVHLYDQQRYVKTIQIRDITAFFGLDHDERIVESVQKYLVLLSCENGVDIVHLNVVLCENKGEIGAHVYNGGKHIKQIPTLELFGHFYTND